LVGMLGCRTCCVLVLCSNGGEAGTDHYSNKNKANNIFFHPFITSAFRYQKLDINVCMMEEKSCCLS
jgi:hypothetical protein